MSGWIKVAKDLTENIRFRRVVRKLRDSNALRGVTENNEALAVTITLGALVRFWCYADSNIRDDDTLDITLDEINEIVGIEGFAQALPAEWLQVIDAECLKLPNFHEHNGSSERQRRNNARRQANFRHRHRTNKVTPRVTDSNARNDARPEETRPEETRPEEIRPEKSKSLSAAPTNAPRETSGWFLDFKLAYPDRAGDQGWRKALKAANARIAEGHRPEEFVDGAKRYAAFIAAKGDTGTEFVKQAATFLGPDKPFLLAWKPPPDKNQQRQDANVSESLKWLESSNAA